MLAKLTTLCLLAALASHLHTCESASLLSQLPGGRFLRQLTHSTLDTLNNVVDGTVGLLSETARAAVGPIVEPILPSCLECAPADPDTNRNVSEIIRSRQFVAEEYDVQTRDGYILTVQRIVNPLVPQNRRSELKPVIMQHGLMSSSVDWVINSVDVRPALPVQFATDAGKTDGAERVRRDTTGAGAGDELADSQEHPNSLGFYLSNRGYDVFLANSRGNIYGQRHVNLSSWEPKFWDFTFDEQIKFDLPDVIAFVQRLTGHQKLGYVGHSQGTAMMFGLLSDQPEYADIVEPFVAFAPVAYVSNAISPVKYFSVYTPIFEHINMWFATSNVAVKYLAPIVCGPQVIRKDICANILFLSVGFNEEELDDSRITAYLSHMPSGTSVKNIAHYGQEVLSGRFAHFDHGILGNQVRYGRTQAPDYELANIRSHSIALFVAENDWLASPKDVAKLRAALKVQPIAVVNMTEVKPKWNHIDFVYGKDAGQLVNTRVEQIFAQFNH